MINKIILVDNNSSRVNNIRKNIVDSSISSNITVTLNGGHALLYLNQINELIDLSKTLILLNIHTPLVNGFEFLKTYNETYHRKKDVKIMVMRDNLDKDDVKRVKTLGVDVFFSAKNFQSTSRSLASTF